MAALVLLSPSSPSSPSSPCFTGKASFLTCCLDQRVEGCPTGGAESSCCTEAKAPSVWLLETFRCWASTGGRGTVYASGPLRSWCCHTQNPVCFGADFSAERCCVRPPARAVANALQTRQESWRSLGEEYHARCRGEAQHPAGIHCVPSWFVGNSRTLLGHILYCGPKVTSFAFHLLMMVGMNYALSLHDPSSGLLGDSDLLASCFRFYDERLRADRFHALEIGAVVLVSPMIKDFNMLEEGLGLHFATLLVHADPRAKVVGLPTSANGTWAWPVLQLRRAYWKLSVVRYPFAYRSWAHPPKFEDMSHCFGGDTTSGTRVYNSSVLRRLLSSSQQSAQLGSAWMLGLDLRLKSHKGTAITCVNSGGTILEEESYLLHTTLGASLARSYDIEAARFHPDMEAQIRCIAPWHGDEALFANAVGMVVPFCVRLALKHAMQKLKEVWEAFRSPTGMLLPIFGSSLSVLRLGGPRGEVIPWDYDADFVLMQPGMDVKEFQRLLEAEGFALRYGDVGTPYKGAEGEEVHLQAEYQDPDLNVTAEIDLWLALKSFGITRALPRTETQLYSLPVTVNSDVLQWMRFRSDTAPRKMKDGRGLPPVKGFECPGHSACLPEGDSSELGFREGAMPDAFAKLDTWD